MTTSRSMVEAYHDCPRLRFNQYHYNGTGVVGVQRAIPLVTGIHVHRGVQHLLTSISKGEQPDVEAAVACAVSEYDNELTARGFRGAGVQTDAQQEYTYREQRALVEALVRVWALREMPRIQARYNVLAAERDIVPLKLAPGVEFLCKVDAELQEKATGDYINYSLKTMSMWNQRSESTYMADLQGVTEIWGVEEDNARANDLLMGLSNLLGDPALGSSRHDILKNLVRVSDYMGKSIRPKVVMGVRFCVLIKGKRLKPEYAPEDTHYSTYSPLIRGYKNINPDGVSYAHSWRYPNPGNKSRTGTLGKGWVPFNVWEQRDMTVKSWIDYLSSGDCQPECGDIVGAQIINPMDYFRDAHEIDEAMREIKHQEEWIKAGLDRYRLTDNVEEKEDILLQYFPHHRRSCEWLFGEPCPFKPMCWTEEVKRDPIGSGLYEVRVPHHEYEVAA